MYKKLQKCLNLALRTKRKKIHNFKSIWSTAKGLCSPMSLTEVKEFQENLMT